MDELKEKYQRTMDEYIKQSGNIAATARALGLPRQTVQSRMKRIATIQGAPLEEISAGRIQPLTGEKYPLPQPGGVNRYIITAAQNNTNVHPGWKNLVAYAEFLDVLPNSSCKLMVGTFTYSHRVYGRHSVKRGRWKDVQALWYAPELTPYIVDHRVELAPALAWCGEMNILPTAVYPLTGMELYNGRFSNVVPHARIAMKSVAALPGEGAKLNYTTGAVTLRNYVQKRAGIIAEQHHSYGALIVEVNHEGNWWVRQLHIVGEDEDCEIVDIGPAPHRTARISQGIVTLGEELVDSITWGDVHASEMDEQVRMHCWGPGGLLDTLAPRRQFMHDVFSMRTRGHHEIKDFHKSYVKHVQNAESVEAEVQQTADFLGYSNRDWCQTIVVRSNHDIHLDRWLNEANPKQDLVNAKYFYALQSMKLQSLERGGTCVLQDALQYAGAPGDILYLDKDESYLICEDVGDGIECGLHGDRGPNGAQGTTRNLAGLSRPVNKGHSHQAEIHLGVYSTGACALRFSYSHGPSSLSISHIVTFKNGARQIITYWNGRSRA